MSPNISHSSTSPSLEAILLVTLSRVGPRLVLHYPPIPSYHKEHHRANSKSNTHEETDDDEADLSDASSNSLQNGSHTEESLEDIDSDELDSFVHRAHVRGSGKGPIHDLQRRKLDLEIRSRVPSSTSISRTASLQDNASRGGQQRCDSAEQTWDTMFSWSTDGLEKLLAPTSRKWHKKRFELCMEDVCFLGCPMFAKEEGGWGSSEKGKTPQKKSKDAGNEAFVESSKTEKDATDVSDSSDDKSMNSSRGRIDDPEANAQISVPGSAAANGEAMSPSTIEPHSLAGTSMTSQSSDPQQSSTNPIRMTMFNLVFVIRPSRMEHQARVKEMYENVVRTFAKALKHLQKQEGYVWKEARFMNSVKEKARANGSSYAATWPKIAHNSSLARAIATTFDRISASEIAHLDFGTFLDISLQIPQPRTTSLVPTPIRSQIPGLQLTTFDPAYSIDEEHERPRSPSKGPKTSMISPYSAVLLLQPPDKLIKDFLAGDGLSYIDPSLGGPLSYLIKHIKPTKTLIQISRVTRGHMTLPDIQLLAQHLIHYRCALAIPPLHPSHIYVPSPNADMRKIREASTDFASRFVSLPSLPTFLAKLGRTFQPYSALIPSSDHKEAYIEILAWMVRGGWLTQLRTFAWVHVSREIKAAVEAKRIRQERANEAAAELANSAIEEESEHADGESEAEDVRVSDVVSADSRASGRRVIEESGIVSAFSPRLKGQLFPPRPVSQAGSASTGVTAVPIDALRERSTARHGSGSSQGLIGRRSRLSDASGKSGEERLEQEAAIDPANFEPSIILSPHKADALESKWLEEIGASLADEDVRIAWPKLLKYFDGRHAIEEIAVQESLKRKVVTPILMKLMGEESVLRIVRHW